MLLSDIVAAEQNLYTKFPPNNAFLLGATGAAGGSRGDFRRFTFVIGARPVQSGEHMHKLLVAAAAAASVGLASLAAPAPAKAGCVGCAVGAGIFGGIVAGAIVGTAIANGPPPPGYYPPPPPGYYPPPPPDYYPPPAAAAPYPPPPTAYYPPPPTAYAQLAPGCHWGQRRVWVEDYGYQMRTVQVCR
jgi:hypothetical protein